MLRQHEPTLLDWAICRPLALFMRAILGVRMTTHAGQWLGAASGLAAIVWVYTFGNIFVGVILAALASLFDGVGRAEGEAQNTDFGFPLLEAIAPARTAILIVVIAAASGLESLQLALIPFLVMAMFFDLSAFRISLKIRGSYRGLYHPVPTASDERLVEVVMRFRRIGLSPVLLGQNEVALIGLSILVFSPAPEWGLAALIIVATAALYWRLTLDHALIRKTLAE